MFPSNGPGAALTDEELYLINEVLSTRFGLTFPESKRSILESRLRPRLEAHGMDRFMDYYLLLQFAAHNGARSEIRHLVEAITNHETYFFRETHQFEALFEHGLDSLSANGTHRTELHLLCAGCATGEEAYTLNIYAQEHRFRHGLERVRIDAFDLDGAALETARRAEYGPHSLRTLDLEQTSRYFKTSGDGRFELRAPYRSGIRFTSGNIVDPSFFVAPAVYDAVFCRNVLIYFSDEAIQRAIRNFARCLRPGGLLFLGHSESIIGRSYRFEPLALGSCMAYRLLESW